MACAEDLGDYFRIPTDGRDLNYSKFVELGSEHLTNSSHGKYYNSHNAYQLDVEEMKSLLLKLELVQDVVQGKSTFFEV